MHSFILGHGWQVEFQTASPLDNINLLNLESLKPCCNPQSTLIGRNSVQSVCFSGRLL